MDCEELPVWGGVDVTLLIAGLPRSLHAMARAQPNVYPCPIDFT